MGLLIISLGGLMIVGGIGSVVYLLLKENKVREEERRKIREEFRTALIREIKKTKLFDFSYSSFVEVWGIERSDADSEAKRVYETYCREAYSDGTISDVERKFMDRLARSLLIAAQTSAELETKARNERYRQAVSSALANGQVSDSSHRELESLRSSLGIEATEGLRLTWTDSRDAYISELKRLVRSGRLTSSLQNDLARLKKTLAITDHATTQLLSNAAEELFRECVTMALQDGVVSTEERRMLQWLQGEAGLTDQVTEPYWHQIRRVDELALYRHGKNLPVIHTTKILEGGETCHWESPCAHRYMTMRNEYRVQGELLATSKRIVMMSPSKSISFAPSTIMNLVLYSDCVELQTNGRQGTGQYFVDDTQALEAILTGIVRKHKFSLVAGFSSAQSRHIPDEVKREVWNRDGGRCVRCSSDQYLEYDHIIPHSRGGANTVNNVQILCRRCNLHKGNRI